MALDEDVRKETLKPSSKLRTLLAAGTAALTSIAAACGGGGGNGGCVTGPDCGNGGGNPAPSINTSTVNLQLDEDSTSAQSLADIVSNGSLNSVTITDGADKINLNFQNDSLYLEGREDQNGSYTLEFKATGPGGNTTQTKSGNITPLTDVSAGQIQNNETDQGGQQAHIRIYTPDGTLLDSATTDTNGNYDKFENVTDEDLVFQAALVDGNKLESYIRTQRTQNGQDLTNTIIRTVPYPTQLVTKEEFQTHIYDVTSVNDNKILKYKLEDLNGVYIVKTNPKSDRDGEFTQTQQETIAETWTQRDNIPKTLKDTVVNTVKGKDSDQNPPYTINESGAITPDDNWIIVLPDTALDRGGIGFPTDSDNDGIIDYSVISLNGSLLDTEDLLKKFSNHEGIHASGGIGHSSLPAGITIMNGEAILRQTPSYVDAKTGSAIYEETYDPLTHLDDIIALDWYGNQ